MAHMSDDFVRADLPEDWDEGRIDAFVQKEIK